MDHVTNLPKLAGCVACFGLGVATLMGGSAHAWHDAYPQLNGWNEGWSLGVHSGRAIEQSVRSGEAFLPFEWEFEDYYVTSTGLRKEVARLWQHSRLFTEASLAWISGDEEYAEIFLTPTITWETFPWDQRIDTRASLGVGLSYTTKAAEIDDTGERVMASMIFELEMQPSSWDWLSVFTRLHHRSNAWGTFGGGSDSKGSNFPSLGVRYHF